MRTLIIALVGVSLASPALAKKKDRGEDNWSNKDSVAGLGAGQTLAGNTGAQFRYFFTKDAGLLVTLGTTRLNGSYEPDKGDSVDFKNNMLGAGIYGEYKLMRGKHASLAGVAGIDYESYSWDDGNDDDSYSDTQLGLGLKAEGWLADRFSIYTQLGLSIDPIGEAEVKEAGMDPDDVSGKGMAISFGGGLLGSAGVTYWFN